MPKFWPKKSKTGSRSNAINGHIYVDNNDYRNNKFYEDIEQFNKDFEQLGKYNKRGLIPPSSSPPEKNSRILELEKQLEEAKERIKELEQEIKERIIEI